MKNLTIKRFVATLCLGALAACGGGGGGGDNPPAATQTTSEISGNTAPSGSTITNLSVSRAIALSEFGFDLTPFSNTAQTFVTVFVAATDWPDSSETDNQQLLLTTLDAAQALSNNNLIRTSLPAGVQFISATVFDGTQSQTRRIAL